MLQVKSELTKEMLDLISETRTGVSVDVARVIAEHIPILKLVAGSPFYIVGEDFLMSIAFSPDGKLLAAVNSDGVKILQVTSNGRLAQIGSFLTGDGGGIGVTFSSSGNFLAVTNSTDNVVFMFCVQKNP